MNFKKYEELGQSDFNQQFREDALKASGLWGHPKANEAYRMAWKNGHKCGLEEVFEHLDMMADMILDTPGDKKFNN